tara:strand:- start:1831 stop:3177 length:1347 start_codon:yes stop_codon:yes gene_type:complete
LKLKTSTLLIAGTLLGAAAIPAQANNDAIVDLLKVLRDQDTITAENYELLVNAAKADQEAVEAIKVDAEKGANPDVKITTKGKLKFEDKDGNWSFQPIGRVMWDVVSVDSDTNAHDDFNGTELRRARLGFEGKVYDWGYKFEGDFAGGNTAIKDAFVSYGKKVGDNKLGFKLGQSQIAFGFNTAASSKYMTFLDRPWYADSQLSPARESGVAAKLSGKSWSVASSLSSGGLSGGKTDKDINGTTFALRGTLVPFKQDKTHLVQVGAGYMNISNAANGFNYGGQHLVAHKDNTKIDTLTISEADYDGSDAFQVDAVGIFGPLHALAEYNNYSAGSKAATGDINFDSYSVETGYFLTGESMKLKHGLWSGVSPKSSTGAWQIAARFESINIDDGIVGDDEAKKWTVGLNYYPTKNIRLMLDYDKVTAWKQAGVDQNAEPSAVKLRVQAKW